MRHFSHEIYAYIHLLVDLAFGRYTQDSNESIWLFFFSMEYFPKRDPFRIMTSLEFGVCLIHELALRFDTVIK